MNSWGYNMSSDFGELKKTHKGIICGKDAQGLQTDEVLVYFEFKHNIPARKAARLLIERLAMFELECDEHGIV